MASSHVALAVQELRRENRDEVHYRSRATGPDGRDVSVLIVNMSRGGLMARCQAPYQRGDRLQFRLPVVGIVAADIRWALGGRVGCQFENSIPLADYAQLLGAMSGG